MLSGEIALKNNHYYYKMKKFKQINSSVKSSSNIDHVMQL